MNQKGYDTLRGLAAGGGGFTMPVCTLSSPLTHRGNKGPFLQLWRGSLSHDSVMRVRNCFLNLPFLKSLHLKTFSVPRRQILGQRVLDPLISSVQIPLLVHVSFTNHIHCCSHFHTINYLSIILLLTVPPNLFFARTTRPVELPRTGVELKSPTVEGQSLNSWTTQCQP